jgi:TetR/AcrR family acrAB operon transcriptional repressor
VNVCIYPASKPEKIKARKTKEEADATRESILRAALDLFSEKGFSRTTFSDIAKRIGMTRGAVYWHFENKEALLTALIEFAHDYKDQLVESKIPDIQTLDDLREAVVMYGRVTAEDELVRKMHFFMHFQMEWSQELLGETHERINEIRRSHLEGFKHCFEVPQIAPHLKEGADLDQLVMTLAAFWMGTCNMFLANCPFKALMGSGDEAAGEAWKKGLPEAIGYGFDLVMNGILKEESGYE